MKLKSKANIVAQNNEQIQILKYADSQHHTSIHMEHTVEMRVA